MVNTADVAAFFALTPIMALAWAWLSSVILSAVVAQSKGQGAIEWIFFSLLFGPLALLAVVGLPDRSRRAEPTD